MYGKEKNTVKALKVKLGLETSLLGYLFLLSCLQCSFAGRPEACNRFEDDIDESVGFKDVKQLNGKTCPADNESFGIYSEADSGNLENRKLVVCWTKGIRRVALQLDQTVSVDSEKPRDQYLATTCSKSNDTILLSRRRTRQPPSTIYLNIPSITGKSYIFKVFIDGRTNKGRKVTPRVQYYKFSIPYKHRVKRTTNQSTVEIPDENECGKSKGCFRKGPAGCGHMNCTYFLSYNASRDRVFLQMSAKSSGWVAVGFSSDKFMGDDEIVMCLRLKQKPQEVEAWSYKARSGHNAPQRMADNIVVLNHYRVSDNYIYCSVSVPFSVAQHQDLSNEWYRLYAYGTVSNSGNPVKHHDLPTVSKKKVDLIYKSNDITSGMTHCQVSSILFLVFLGIGKILTI